MVTRSEMKTPFGSKLDYFVAGEWVWSEYTSDQRPKRNIRIDEQDEETAPSWAFWNIIRRRRRGKQLVG